MTPIDPDLCAERALVEAGAVTVGGMDEVGRGAWAGPVSVGVVVVDASLPAFPEGVRDSKVLSRRRREGLVPLILEWALDASVGHATARECDELGMRRAVALAGRRALAGLGVQPDALIVDGPLDLLGLTEIPETGLFASLTRRGPKVEAIVKADRTCATVAAASILAKVSRDDLLGALAPSYPGFDFDSNVGYPSPSHQCALRGYGLTAIHRRSWSYVDELPWATDRLGARSGAVLRIASSPG